MPNNMFLLSTLNGGGFTEHASWPFKPRLPKVSLKKFMSLDHKPKMRWHTLDFVVILCKYGLLLEKPLFLNMRKIIWAVSFDLSLEPNPCIDVDDVMGYKPNW